MKQKGIKVWGILANMVFSLIFDKKHCKFFKFILYQYIIGKE